MSIRSLLGWGRRHAPEPEANPSMLGETRYLPGPAAADLKAIKAWWEGLCSEAAIPARSGLSPHALKPFLPKIQLIEVLDGGRDYHIRLFGTDWVTATRGDFTNRLLSNTINQAVREKWMHIYGLVVASAAPLSFTTNLNNVGRDFMYVEELLLPFSRDTEQVAFLLAAITRQ